MIPKNIISQVDQIFSSDRSEVEKISAALHLIADFQIQNARNNCELYRASGDHESLIKEQIKQSTTQHMLSLYDECYFRATGSRWEGGHHNEQD